MGCSCGRAENTVETGLTIGCWRHCWYWHYNSQMAKQSCVTPLWQCPHAGVGAALPEASHQWWTAHYSMGCLRRGVPVVADNGNTRCLKRCRQQLSSASNEELPIRYAMGRQYCRWCQCGRWSLVLWCRWKAVNRQCLYTKQLSAVTLKSCFLCGTFRLNRVNEHKQFYVEYLWRNLSLRILFISFIGRELIAHNYYKRFFL